MTDIQQGILTLIQSAVTQTAHILPEGFDLEAAYPLIRHHQIPTLAFEGALLCGLPRNTPVMQKLFRSYCKALAVTEGQLRQTGRILAAFQEAGIHHMPLKGYHMRPRYPKPELRLMGDSDILIRTDQYDKIVPIMERLGFTAKVESDHEYIWEHPSLNVELHKRIVPSYNQDLYAYFGSGWDFSARQEGYCHFMSPEDEFVYIFSHMTKHYRGGGIGCRHITDLWVFLRRYPELDEALMEEKLKQLGLTAFYGNIRRLIAVWFDGAESDEKTEFITQYLFDSGTYGGEKTHVLSEGLRNAAGVSTGFRGKLGYLRNLVFPKMLSMEQMYPVLEKWPVLLPVFWLWRPFDKIFIQKKSFRVHRQKLAMLTTDNLKSREAALRYVGLEFK